MRKLNNFLKKMRKSNTLHEIYEKKLVTRSSERTNSCTSCMYSRRKSTQYMISSKNTSRTSKLSDSVSIVMTNTKKLLRNRNKG